MIELYYKLTEKILVLTGFRYWYNIKIQYINKEKRDVFLIIRQIGLADRREILNHRVIKKSIFGKKGIQAPNRLLSNGSLEIISCEYLGLMKKK